LVPGGMEQASFAGVALGKWVAGIVAPSESSIPVVIRAAAVCAGNASAQRKKAAKPMIGRRGFRPIAWSHVFTAFLFEPVAIKSLGCSRSKWVCAALPQVNCIDERGGRRFEEKP
jgi:hypothetical protein